MSPEQGGATRAQTLQKVPTRIPGLDDILEGGLPAGRTSLVSGGPGSGKSVLGLEFLYRGALAGKPGVFVTFEESSENIRCNASTLGRDLRALEEAGRHGFLGFLADCDMVLDQEVQGRVATKMLRVTKYRRSAFGGNA